MKLYRIRNWSDLFENNRTRELKHMAWVPVPNRHDGDGYTTLVSRKNGAAIYGAWMVILQVASRCDPRGTLLRAPQKPHDAASISRITRLPEADIQAALDACTTETQWLEVEDIPTIPQEGAAKPQGDAPIPQGGAQEWNGKKELKGKEAFAVVIYEAYPKKVGRKDAMKAILKAITMTDAPEFLLDRTNAYAAARKGQDQQYTLHPATFFNGEHYHDDPAAWKPSNGIFGKPSTDRNAGTANEGKADQYAGVGRVVPLPNKG